MPYINPTCLTFAASDILTASAWNAAKDNFTSLMTDPSTFGLVKPSSGVATTQPGSFGQVVVSSGVATTQPGSFGSLNVLSGTYVRGSVAMQLAQSVLATRYAVQANCTTTFSTYMVASITPLFADSVIKVRAEFGVGTIGGENARVNLCRAPNGTPVVLTISDAAVANMDGVAGSNVQALVSFTAQESNLSGALQYGIRFAASNLGGNYARGHAARILVEEWR